MLSCALAGLPLLPRAPCLKAGQQPSPEASLPLSAETTAGWGRGAGVCVFAINGWRGREVASEDLNRQGPRR